MSHSSGSDKKISLVSILSIFPSILTPTMFTCALLFLLILRQLNMLPTGWFILVAAIMLMLLFGFSRMMRMSISRETSDSSDGSRKGSRQFLSIAGIILSLLLCIGSLTGAVLMTKTLNTLQEITTVSEVVVNDMVVYVRNDDSAETLNDTVSYSYGIMETHNRDISDAAIEKLNSNLSASLTVKTCAGPIKLVQALLADEVDAILFSPLYFDLLASEEAFSNLTSAIRALTTFQVETVLTVPSVTQTEESSNQDETTEAENSEPERNPNILTIYLSGVDAFSDINGIANGDVNIIATINKETHQILLISTPRDSYVELANQDGQYDKLTHAAYYGIDSSIATLENFYGVDIDYYVRVNFWGLANLVNVLGGIDIYNPDYFESDDTFFNDEPEDGYEFYVGNLHLNGGQALTYARTRHGLAHGDMTRGNHQMIVIRGILDKVLSPAILNDVDGFLNAVGRNLITNVPSDVISELVKEQLATNPEWELVSYAPYGEGEWNISFTLGNQYTATVVLFPETVETAKQLLQDIRKDKLVSVPENAR